MITWFKNYIQPNPEKILHEQLNFARLEHIKAQGEKEHWDAMVPMLSARISRLKREIAKSMEQPQETASVTLVTAKEG